MFAALYTRLVVPAGFVLAAMLVLLIAETADANKVRIKDICAFQDAQEVDLIGYGLVVGLDGTGDGAGTEFTTRAVSNMMERMGLTIDVTKLKIKNIAAVIITAKLSSQQVGGSYFDITVSSLGDAKSLQGGTLLMTPLSDPSGVTRAIAQGAVSIGGFNVQVDDNNKIVNNYTLVGRVPGGGKVTEALQALPGTDREFYLALHNPDLTTSHRVAERINIKYGNVAYSMDGGTVKVVVPDSVMYPTLKSQFMSDIAHGTITVTIQSRPVISQPEAFSDGQTVVTQESYLSAMPENARVVQLNETITLADVANALNKIGATPRDIIAIFQSLKQVGALRAELVIL
jgi:flagellar P-ring protein precursor FlgI